MSVSQLIQQAESATKQGNWEEAIERLELALHNPESNLDTVNRLVQAYAVLGRYDEALQVYIRFLKRCVDNGEDTMALEVAGEALEVYPLADEPRQTRVLLFQRLGRLDEMVAEARSLAHLYMEKGQGDQSIEILKGVQKATPERVEIGFELAEMFLSHGNIQDGANQFRKTAFAFMEQGRIVSAIRAFSRLKIIAPDDIESLMTLGRLYIDQGQLEEAEQEFRAVLRTNLTHEEALLNLGRVGQLRGQYRHGLMAIQKLLTTNENHYPAHEKNGELQYLQGMMDDAVESFLTAGKGYRSIEEDEKSVYCFQVVLGLRAGHPEALQYLAEMGAEQVAIELEAEQVKTPVEEEVASATSAHVPLSKDAERKARRGETPQDSLQEPPPLRQETSSAEVERPRAPLSPGRPSTPPRMAPSGPPSGGGLRPGLVPPSEEGGKRRLRPGLVRGDGGGGDKPTLSRGGGGRRGLTMRGDISGERQTLSRTGSAGLDDRPTLSRLGGGGLNLGGEPGEDVATEVSEMGRSGLTDRPSLGGSEGLVSLEPPPGFDFGAEGAESLRDNMESDPFASTSSLSGLFEDSPGLSSGSDTSSVPLPFEEEGGGETGEQQPSAPVAVGDDLFGDVTSTSTGDLFGESAFQEADRDIREEMDIFETFDNPSGGKEELFLDEEQLIVSEDESQGTSGELDPSGGDLFGEEPSAPDSKELSMDDLFGEGEQTVSLSPSSAESLASGDSAVSEDLFGDLSSSSLSDDLFGEVDSSPSLDLDGSGTDASLLGEEDLFGESSLAELPSGESQGSVPVVEPEASEAPSSVSTDEDLFGDSQSEGDFLGTSALLSSEDDLFGDPQSFSSEGGAMASAPTESLGEGDLFGSTQPLPSSDDSLGGSLPSLSGTSQASLLEEDLFGETQSLPSTQEDLFGDAPSVSMEEDLFGETQSLSIQDDLFGSPLEVEDQEDSVSQELGFEQELLDSSEQDLFSESFESGSAESQASSTGDDLFGDSQAPSAGDDLFGDSQAPSTGDDLFGDSQAPSAGEDLFGDSQAPSAGDDLFGDSQAPSAGDDLFGDSQALSAGDDLFGDSQASSVGDDLFGDSQAPSAGDDLFGDSQASSVGDGLFGDSQAPSAGDDLFGDSQAPSADEDLFGEISSASMDEELFGDSQAPSAEEDLFGDSQASSTDDDLFGDASVEEGLFGESTMADEQEDLFGSTESSGLGEDSFESQEDLFAETKEDSLGLDLEPSLSTLEPSLTSSDPSSLDRSIDVLDSPLSPVMGESETKEGDLDFDDLFGEEGEEHSSDLTLFDSQDSDLFSSQESESRDIDSLESTELALPEAGEQSDDGDLLDDLFSETSDSKDLFSSEEVAGHSQEESLESLFAEKSSVEDGSLESSLETADEQLEVPSAEDLFGLEEIQESGDLFGDSPESPSDESPSLEEDIFEETLDSTESEGELSDGAISQEELSAEEPSLEEKVAQEAEDTSKEELEARILGRPTYVLGIEKEVDQEDLKVADELLAKLEASDVATQINGYRKAIEEAPDNLVLRSRLADLHMRYGLLDEAVMQYRQVIRKSPESISLRHRLVQAHLWNDNLSDAAGELLEIAQMHRAREESQDALDVLQTVLSLEPDHFEARKGLVTQFSTMDENKLAAHHLRQLAETAHNKGNIEEAIDAFIRLIAISDDPQYQERLAQVYEIQGDMDAALAQYKQLAKRYLDKEDKESAATAIAKIVSLDEDDIRARRQLIEIYEHLSLLDRALSQQFELARYHHQRDELQDAIELYEKVLAELPSNMDARHSLVEVYLLEDEVQKALTVGEPLKAYYLEQEKYEIGVELYKKLIEKDSLNTLLRHQIIEFLTCMQEDEQALSQWLKLVEIHRSESRFSEAVNAYREAIELAPDRADLYFELALLHRDQLSQPLDAIEQLESVYRLAPDDSKASEALVRLLLEKDQAERAGEILREQEQMGDEGSLLRHSIISELKEKIDKNLRDYHARYIYGQLCYYLEEMDLAIEQFQKTRQSEEFLLRSYNMLGLCFARKRGFNMVDLAIKQFEKGLTTTSKNDGDALLLRYNLATILRENGRLEEALERFKECYSMDIAYRDVRENIEDLELEIAQNASKGMGQDESFSE